MNLSKQLWLEQDANSFAVQYWRERKSAQWRCRISKITYKTKKTRWRRFVDLVVEASRYNPQVQQLWPF